MKKLRKRIVSIMTAAAKDNVSGKKAMTALYRYYVAAINYKAIHNS